MSNPGNRLNVSNQLNIQAAHAEHERAYSVFMTKTRAMLTGAEVVDQVELERLARDLEEKFKLLRAAWGLEPD